jgi:hypothetical protein
VSVVPRVGERFPVPTGHRLHAVSVLVCFYALKPFVGIAALAGGFGYVIGRRTHREELEPD